MGALSIKVWGGEDLGANGGFGDGGGGGLEMEVWFPSGEAENPVIVM